MNRTQRRASLSCGAKLQKKGWNDFKDVTVEAISKARRLNPTSCYRPHTVLQNNLYIVQIFQDRQILGRNAIKAMVRRRDAKPMVEWHDLQRIKNEVFGKEVTAIQVFPPESELTDEANLYWLWVLEQ